MEYAMRKTERAARSVKTQFLIFLVTLFVFLLIFCILLIYTATQAMLSENLQYIQEDQTEFQTALNEMSSQAATAAKRIQYDTACRTFLSATQWNQISPSLIREVNAAIGAAQLGDSMLAEIAFVSDLVNWSSLFLPSQLAEMQQAMPEKRELVPLGIYTPGKPKSASYFVFGYRYYIGRDRDAALFLSVELTGAGSQLPISQIPGCRFILTDAKQDACLFGTDDRELPVRLGGLQEKAAAADGGLVRTSHWLVQCTELPQIGCTLLCVVDRWQNQPSMSISYLITVIFLLVFAGLLVFGIGMFYRSVISPLNEFSRTIAVIREKKLRKLDEPLVLSGCSELQAVGRDFSELLVSINTLTGEILQKSNALYEAEVLRQSAELDMLRSQINPHFLYNTLELIRAMAIKGDIDHVSMITSAMGKIYRYTAKGDSLVPLAQEVEDAASAAGGKRIYPRAGVPPVGRHALSRRKGGGQYAFHHRPRQRRRHHAGKARGAGSALFRKRVRHVRASRPGQYLRTAAPAIQRRRRTAHHRRAGRRHMREHLHSSLQTPRKGVSHMFQVLLADDEPSVTDALRRSINWAACGLEVAAVVTSGEEALACINERPIHIVITDIRMANTDGLSLCQQISRMNRGIQTIIISGFAEFSYAQKALSYGALAYCLKPLEYDELKRHLQRAVHRLREASHLPDHDDLLDALQNGDVPELRATLHELGLPGDAFYAAVCVGKAAFPMLPSGCITLHLGYRKDAYISAEPFSQQGVRAYLSDLASCGLSYTISAVNAAVLPRTIKNLSSAAFRFFITPGRKLAPEKQEDHAAPYLREIARAAALGDAVRTVSLLDKLHGPAGQSFTLHSVWRLYSILFSCDAFGASLAPDDIYSPEQLVFRYQSFPELLTTLRERICAGAPISSGEGLSNAGFLQMMRYIDTHYDRRLSLSDLAKEMNLNANYLSQVFKKETGKTFLKYITGLRIEKAKELLDSGDYSISDTAAALGFNDYFYFLKTFKRVTGLTPKQYRHGYTAEDVAAGELPDEDDELDDE